ncbi:extracellular solute-binding protein [Haliangium ochraceum]|uniref:Spermidine/putrescine-binding periplasmic protein-like protein n=1 Tax=Haliangium ochraceum (strain DSM 14365 / JCM 11303 / SMP-2) TaxID=502025 RepID=D0LNS1_HALO1|nr:extracellular solute-binding protein [Haliangium ochraceum]ACY16976.1 Spermidine/putrescine-binding periplasmic protein-like protein [Haliangium ochraceum DSM 14365]
MSAPRRHLRVLSWGGRWGDALRAAVDVPFERATGVEVVQVPHVGLRLPPQLSVVGGRAGPPPVDVVWCNTIAAREAEARGLCEPLELATLTDPGQLYDIATRGVRDGEIGFVRMYMVHYALGCLRDAPGSLRGPRVERWRDLLAPALAGKIATYPGGNGIFAIAQAAGGGDPSTIPEDMDACWEFLARLGPRIAVQDYSIGMERLLRSRRVTVCFRALPNILGFQQQGIPMALCVPQEGTSSTTDAMWLPRGLSEEARVYASAYLAFALSAPVQERWCALLGAAPVHRAARLPGVLAERPELAATPDDSSARLDIDEDVLLAHHERWAAHFTELSRLRRSA